MIELVPENPDLHADAVEALYDRTFGPGHFAKTAERLREGNTSLPACSRLALADGAVVGACRIWPVEIGEARSRAVFVGPLAVDPEWQGKRHGQDLTRAALEASARAGWPLAIIIGSPDYFLPVGFERVPAGQLWFPGPQDPGRVMYRELDESAALPTGLVNVPARHAPCF